MDRPAQKAVALVVGVLVVMLVAGCEEGNLSEPTPNVKMSRLIANENRRLKKELGQRDKEIEKQKELLAKCNQEKETWKEKAKQNIREQVDAVVTVIMDKNAQLRKENENLKAQIAELKKEIERLKKPE